MDVGRVYAALDELEAALFSGVRVGGRVVVSQRDLQRRFSDLRSALPDLAENEKILLEARMEAKRILAEAAEKARQEASSMSVVTSAKEQAREAIRWADAQAEDILSDARTRAARIERHTKGVLNEVRSHLQEILDSLPADISGS